MTKDVTYNGLTFEPYITRDKIDERVAELGRRLTAEHRNDRPLFLCVLTGAFPFASDLFRQFDGDAEIAFIRLKSYDGMGSTGNVKEVMGLTADIKDRTVIVIEDIIDTGNTMHRLIADLKSKGPKHVKIATLLFKPEALEKPVTPDYVGFEIPKKFIIGYGLDLDGLARNLNDIYVLKDQGSQS